MNLVIPAAPGTILYNPDDPLDVHTIVGWLVYSGGTATPVTLRRIDDLTPYRVAHSGGDHDEVPSTPRRAPVVRHTKAKSDASEVITALSGRVRFSGKEYLKRTFWQLGEVGVMVMEGSNRAPEGPGVKKITRDDYFKLRKEMGEVNFADLRDGLNPATYPEADPEDDGTDNDDDDDLI